MPLPIPAPRASGYTTSTRVPLYWARYGPEDAKTILVLHGGPGASHDYLLPQMLELTDRYQLLFYDQRGGGRSRTDDPTPITWRMLVNDLTKVIEEFWLEPLSILGYSWGGLLALLYALDAAYDRKLRHPRRLLLLDPAPVSRQLRERFEAEFAERQRSPAIQQLRDELAASGLRERDPDAYRQRAFELSVAGYFADPRRAANLTPFRVIGKVQQSVWESLAFYDLVPDLDTVRCPGIIVHGRQDPIPLESSQRAAEQLGHKLVVLDDCGHVSYVEQPAALFTALRAFLATTDTLLDHP
ncbi:MAG TPA: alpha/beta hydrolase [Gemmatimonadaceae bacterium]|nr:alpha/beta hydrolase [Gemmatimonadaceae bacterium]